MTERFLQTFVILKIINGLGISPKQENFAETNRELHDSSYLHPISNYYQIFERNSSVENVDKKLKNNLRQLKMTEMNFFQISDA